MTESRSSSVKPMSKKQSVESNIPLLAMDMPDLEKTALKNLLSEFCAAGHSIKPLISLLSTIYANESVARGLLASLQSRLNTTPILMNRETMIEQSKLTFESLWMIDSICSEWTSFLEAETKKYSAKDISRE